VTTHLLSRAGSPTTVKTRIMAGAQQICRVDRESVEDLAAGELAGVKTLVSRERPDAVIISDYGKGMITPGLISFLTGFAGRRRIVIMVDPKVEHFNCYRKVTCLTPNLAEASLGIHRPQPRRTHEIVELGRDILAALEPRHLVITLGRDGMLVFRGPRDVFRLPAVARQVFDVTGAGDTVIAAMTLALACDADILQAAALANLAAGVVVQKVGAATASPAELRGIAAANKGLRPVRV
jgi:rfaE bifunctional protein kinase chain/domain